MEFIIVSGISGAGKTSVLHAMEDIGFYCVDNIPPALLSTFYELCEKSTDARMKHVAVVIDVRGTDVSDSLSIELAKLRRDNRPYKILFLDASNDVLVRRFSATRRKHPLFPDTTLHTINEAVNMERTMLSTLKESADYLIDSSYLSAAQLKERVTTLFLDNDTSALAVTCMSFGFKYGTPTEADVMFDVRCLPNPFYIEELKYKNGLDKEVKDYVMKWEQTHGVLDRILDLLDYMLPLYADEGKSQLVIAIGCTGGKHRSVALTQEVYCHLTERRQKVSVHHRDIRKA